MSIGYCLGKNLVLLQANIKGADQNVYWRRLSSVFSFFLESIKVKPSQYKDKEIFKLNACCSLLTDMNLTWS